MARRSASGPQVANVGDIAYKASNGKIKVVAPDLWDASLGTPVGVVVIPSGFAPDNGLARIVSLYWANYNGAASATYISDTWSSSGDVPLDYYNRVPQTDNKSAISNSYGAYGSLPSDIFIDTGNISFVDNKSAYDVAPMIPSPYKDDGINNDYFQYALSDIDGKGNTDILVALGSDYYAANAARNYKAAGAEEIEWYLPAAGEWGFIAPRYSLIKKSLQMVGVVLTDDDWCWLSTMYVYNSARSAKWDFISYKNRFNAYCGTRPFAMLDF